MSHILILGGAGFIGSNLASNLLNEGFHVIVADKTSSPVTFPNEKNLIWVEGDISSAGFLSGIFKNNPIDCVIHLVSSLIPSSGYSDFYKGQDLNILAGYELIRIMLEHGCSKLIFFSTGGAIYGRKTNGYCTETDTAEPINYYGFSKLIFEEYLKFSARTNGLKYLIIRPSNPYGKGQNLAGKQGLISVSLGRIKNRLPLEVWGDGKIVRDYLHISDLTQAIVALLRNNKWNETFNIGSGEGKSVNEILELIRTATGIDFAVEYHSSREVDTPVNILNIEKIKKETGWEPKISLIEGIQSLWNDLKDK